MKKVNTEALDSAFEFIKANSDDLYVSLFKYHFLQGSAQKVLSKLKGFQNADGGFGHGLEPDFLLPDSSPMATTIAFQIMDKIGEKDESMLSAAVKFYEKTFDKERNGWWSVPVQVNDHPHAPWWTYDPQQKCTVIDYSWGNPSSEIIGILYENRRLLTSIEIEPLLDHAIDRLNGIEEFKSEHEIYCYLRLYRKLPEGYQVRIKDTLSKAIKALVCLDRDKWDTYVPKPLDFIQNRQHALFSEVEAYAEDHCDYLVDSMQDGIWQPTWEWGQYEHEWKKSRKNWAAVLTIRNWLILREFDRLA